MKSGSNPFIISGYEGAEYFCDRKEETQRLKQEIVNGNNVALVASRRMGKSGLIHHLFEQQEIKKGYNTFFIDIYDTKSLNELVFRLSREIVTKLRPRGKRSLKLFWDCMRSLQPGISFSPMGEVSFNLQVGDIKESRTTLDEIFQYIEKSERPCIIAIDEFQQISEYSEGRVEATLRTYVQQCHNAVFIFSGSQRHTMSTMFTSAARPFFQSVSMMSIDSIDIEKYTEFAKKHFKNGGKTLSDGVVEKVYDISRGITWYTQKLLNTLYNKTGQNEICTPEMVDEALEEIIKIQSFSYEETMFRMPEKQKRVLIALAKNGPTKEITSGAFVRKYILSSPSTVQSAMRGLLEKDFVTYEKGTYSVYDLFMEIWLNQQY